MERVATSEDRAAAFRALFEDERRFRLWYEQAIPRVYGYLFDRCGGVRSLAEELTQEAFVEAVRHRSRYDGRSDPLTWVISIARHKLADHFRRLGREERRHLRLISGTAEAGADDPWRAAESREDVLRALRTLPATQQAALVLHYLDRMSVSEIAVALGRSEAAVESLLSRGREAFRRAIGPEDAEGADDV